MYPNTMYCFLEYLTRMNLNQSADSPRRDSTELAEVKDTKFN